MILYWRRACCWFRGQVSETPTRCLAAWHRRTHRVWSGVWFQNTWHICRRTQTQTKPRVQLVSYITCNKLHHQNDQAQKKRNHRWFHSVADGHINFFPHYLCHKMFFGWVSLSFSSKVFSFFIPSSSTLFSASSVWVMDARSWQLYTECGEAQRAQWHGETPGPSRITQSYESSSLTAASRIPPTWTSYQKTPLFYYNRSLWLT